MMEYEPAFPNTGNSTWNLRPQGGMSLRDWFAGQAMVVLVTQNHGNDWGLDGEWHYPICAEKAYRAADAMLAERNKEENN